MPIIPDRYPPVACPDWCALPSGHDHDLSNVDQDGSLYVRHCRPIADVGGFSLDIEQLVIVHLDGTIETEPATVELGGRNLSGADAGRFADALVTAAAFVGSAA